MTILNLYGGPLKQDIIQRAYGLCGLSSTQFELSPEEYNVGLRALNDQMATLPGIGFNFPDYGDGSPSDESGLDPADVLAVTSYVAQLLAPQIGKTLSLSAGQTSAVSSLRARYIVPVARGFGRSTPRGAGSRRWFGSEYLQTNNERFPQ